MNELLKDLREEKTKTTPTKNLRKSKPINQTKSTSTLEALDPRFLQSHSFSLMAAASSLLPRAAGSAASSSSASSASSAPSSWSSEATPLVLPSFSSSRRATNTTHIHCIQYTCVYIAYIYTIYYYYYLLYTLILISVCEWQIDIIIHNL